MNMLLTILVLAGVLFGGGATVNAAQDDLPNESLYEIKLWAEDLSLQFQNNEEAAVNRLMELAQVRMQEMASLAENGEPIPDRVRLRLEQHIQQALQLCANMDDPMLERTLLQLRDRLREQDRDMEQIQLRTQDQQHLQTQDQLRQQLQTRAMLKEQLLLVEEGLNNRELFRNQVQNSFQYGQDEELTPPAQNGNGEQDGQPNLDPGGTPNNSGRNGGNGLGGNSKP